MLCFSFVDKMVCEVDSAWAHNSEVDGNKHKIEFRYRGKVVSDVIWGRM